MRIMNVASAARKQQDEVKKQLNIGETRADLTRRLKETAKVTGEQLSEDQINAAIDSYFSGLYSFNEPKRSFAYALAEVKSARQ